MEGFDTFDFHLKCDILRKFATYITSTGFNHYTVKLYTWDKFFIEEYYDNEIEETTRISIAGDNDMEKYLDEITLNDLIRFS
ncbi:MAG TPA: hypothetical protein VD927_03245 [Chryseosolibacter sp.]|nr:hypothetical protein [Chryseosolibacter sp.]